ncbi:hypothetical protein [Nocardiopsis nanhaiensis]
MPAFRCRDCRTALTNAMREVPLPDIDDAASPFDLGRADCPPRMTPGTFAFPGRGQREGSGNPVLARADVPGTRYTADRRRMSGCCGPAGIDGLNLLCAGCGAEVGTESSDCWTVHQVVLDSAAVEPVEA